MSIPVNNNNNNLPPPPPLPTQNSSFSLLSVLNRERLNQDGSNYIDWIRTLRFTLRYENKEYVLDNDIPELGEDATPDEITAYNKHYDESTKVACLMLATMASGLQKNFENWGAFDINQKLKEMFQEQARQERFEIVKSLMACKQQEGASVCAHVQKMKSYIDRLGNLGVELPKELTIDMVLNSLSSSYSQFIMNFNMNNLDKTLMELHGMLKTAEASMKKPNNSNPTAPVLAIDRGSAKRKWVSHPKGKGKAKVGQSDRGPKRKVQVEITPSADPNEAIYFYCQSKGHWKHSCPKYLEDLKKGKVKVAGTSGMFMIELHSTSTSNSWILDTGCGTHICSDMQGLRQSRKLRHGELNLIMGNRHKSGVTRIGNYELMLSDGVYLSLLNCCFLPDMARNIISFHALYKDGCRFSYDNDNGDILVYKNGCFIFKASPCKGVYESVVCVGEVDKLLLNVGSSNSELDKSCLWHCRLGHINKKRIAKLQSDGILESFDLKSDDVCESCLLGKMTKAPFTGHCERGKDLLDLIHTDVCGPFKSATRHGERYFVTFTDDFSRYGYIYLIKHKSETFEVFKEFQNEVENQLGRKIKMLRSDRGGEYLSLEFYDHLKNCGIVSQLSPPRTPQLNGVAERRN